MLNESRMWIWTLTVISCFAAIKAIYYALAPTLQELLCPGEARSLREVSSRLHDLQENLLAGISPSPEIWQSIRKLDAPWGELAAKNLQDLRDRGASLVPSLRRLRSLAEEHQTLISQARSKSAQSLGQAGVCAFLIPIMGVTLYWLLPELQNQTWIWILLCLLATGWTAVGALWMFKLSEKARWGGLPKNQRHWILSVNCSGERLLALIRSGVPADLAWNGAIDVLNTHSPQLAEDWGIQLWEKKETPLSNKLNIPGCRTALSTLGVALKQTLVISLMDGKPCTERLESALTSFRAEIQNRTEHALALLPNQTLKPLFICVAPSAFGLLASGTALSLISESGLWGSI